MGSIFDMDRPLRIRPLFTLDKRPRTHAPFIVRAKNLRANDESHRIPTTTTTTTPASSAPLLLTSTAPAAPQDGTLTAPAAPQDGTLTAPAAPQFANQVLINNTTAVLANQVDGNDAANNVIDNEIDVTDLTGDEFITLSNPFGSGGECRHNYHCRGQEKCVRRNGRYICTRHFCNVDSDCPDARLCRDQRCRRCRRCRDTLQAPVPK